MTEKKPGEPGERDKALAKNLCICLGLAEREQDLEPFDVGTAAVAFAATRRAGAREALERAPHERNPEERAELFSRLEVLSNRLCQTQAYILDALEQAGLTVAIRALADQPEAEGKHWHAVPPNVQHWIINILLHPMATGHYSHPTVLSEAEYDERRNAARAAINLLAAGTGYVLALAEPIKPEPPLNCNASKAEILENHEKRIAFLEKIACGGPVLYNEKRVLSLAEPPHPPAKADAPGTCALCGKPMPPGEEMFKYHGYSGPCPEPEAAHGRKPE